MGEPCGRASALPVPSSGLLTRTVPPTLLAGGGGSSTTKKEATMSQSTPASFDARLFPYALSDDTEIKLRNLQGLLRTLADLSGEADRVKPNHQPEISNSDLHRTLWGLSDMFDAALDEIVVRPFESLSNYV
jgi:hypothetical protein